MTTRAPNSDPLPINYRIAKLVGEKLARRLGYRWGTGAVGEVLRPFIANMPAWATDALGIGAAAIVQSPRRVAEWIGSIAGFDADKVDKILNEAVDDGIQSFLAGVRTPADRVPTDADCEAAADKAMRRFEERGEFDALLSSDKSKDVFDCVDSLKNSEDAAQIAARNGFYAMLATATGEQRETLRKIGSDRRWQSSEIMALLTQAGGRLDVFLNMLEAKVARPKKSLSEKLTEAAAAALQGQTRSAGGAKLRKNAERLRRDLDRKAQQLQRSSDAIRAILRRK